MRGLGGKDDADEESRKARQNARLSEWLGENGVWMKDKSGWGVPPHPLLLSSKTIDEIELEDSGRGLICKYPINMVSWEGGWVDGGRADGWNEVLWVLYGWVGGLVEEEKGLQLDLHTSSTLPPTHLNRVTRCFNCPSPSSSTSKRASMPFRYVLLHFSS